jgi:hypothetical protein
MMQETEQWLMRTRSLELSIQFLIQLTLRSPNKIKIRIQGQSKTYNNQHLHNNREVIITIDH